MAKMEQIPILGRMRGKVGDLIVKRYRDKYVVTAMPTPPDKRSEKQKVQSQRFADAQHWARHATRDSPTKELYDQAVADLDRASNTVAVSDYLRPPTISKVDLADYQGQAGARLTIAVENVVPVWQVAVFIVPAKDDDAASDPERLDKRALELGLAKPGEDGEWSYTTKKDAGTGEGEVLTVVIRATDHPGNSVEQRVELPKA